MIAMKLRYMKGPSHVYCQLHSAPAKDHTYALNGNLIFSLAEWPDARDRLARAGIDIEQNSPPQSGGEES